MPKMGATVTTVDNRSGVVVGLNQLYETVKVRYEVGEKSETLDVPLADIVSKGKGSTDRKEREDEVPDELKKLED